MNIYKIWILNVILLFAIPLWAMTHDLDFPDNNSERTSSEESLSVENLTLHDQICQSQEKAPPLLKKINTTVGMIVMELPLCY